MQAVLIPYRYGGVHKIRLPYRKISINRFSIPCSVPVRYRTVLVPYDQLLVINSFFIPKNKLGFLAVLFHSIVHCRRMIIRDLSYTLLFLLRYNLYDIYGDTTVKDFSNSDFQNLPLDPIVRKYVRYQV